MVADLADLAACEAICAGVDGIVHLGGQAVEADWDTVLQANIIGCYNLFEAARRQGVKRVVFATTNHVIGFYRRTQRIDHTVPAAPGQPLWRQQGVRRGARAPLCRQARAPGAQHPDRQFRRPAARPAPALDLAQPARFPAAGADRARASRPALRDVYGASENDRTWWDNANAYRLGYRPQDESEPFAPDILAAEPEPTDLVAEQFQGGPFCSAEFTAIRTGSTDGKFSRAGASRG